MRCSDPFSGYEGEGVVAVALASAARGLAKPTDGRQGGSTRPARAAEGCHGGNAAAGLAAGAGGEGDDLVLLGVGEADAVSSEAPGATVVVGETVELGKTFSLGVMAQRGAGLSFRWAQSALHSRVRGA